MKVFACSHGVMDAECEECEVIFGQPAPDFICATCGPVTTDHVHVSHLHFVDQDGFYRNPPLVSVTVGGPREVIHELDAVARYSSSRKVKTCRDRAELSRTFET